MNRREAFNTIVSEVCKHFEITKQEIFTKTKEHRISEGRQAIFYIARHSGMRVVEIQGFMRDNGYECPHSSIIYGIDVGEAKMGVDKWFKKMVIESQKAV